MGQRGVELRGVYVSQQPKDGVVQLQITLSVMCDSELEAIGWLVSMLEES